MSASLKDGTRQDMDATASGPAAALTPRVGESDKGCGDGTSRAGPDESSGAFPEGWQLGAESWRFHRQFFVRVGRPATQGEYSAIIAQIRWHTAARLDRHHYQVMLRDGSPLIVSGSWHRLNGVEPTGWTPRAAEAVAQPQPPAPPLPTPAPQARTLPIAPEPPRQPLRASTLTLANPAAAKVLAERLRRFGIPADQASP